MIDIIFGNKIISIKGNDESDYLALRRLLKGQRISIGEYLMDAYRELDKDNVDIDVIDIGLTKNYSNQPNKSIPNAKHLNGSYYPYGINELR